MAHVHVHGVNCACMTGGSVEHRALPSTIEPLPTLSGLSPFSPAQELATRNVLAQVHPDLAISRSALTLLMRLQDALAHALLARAFKGLNPPFRPGRTPEALLNRPHSPLPEDDPGHAETFALQELDPTHAIHFNFPAGVGLREVARHADAERAKAVQEYITGQLDGDHHHPDSFQFGRNIAHRWWIDFQRAVERGEDGEAIKLEAKRRQEAKDEAEEKRTGREKAKKPAAAAGAGGDASPSASESKQSELDPKKPYMLYPDVLQTTLEQISLLAMVEYCVAEVAELAGNRALDRGSGALHLMDIWCSLAQDEELRGLVRYLNVSWDMRGISALPSPLHASSSRDAAPQESFGLPPVSYLLEEEFATSLAAQEQVNLSSWYQTPAKVKEYAIKFARGEMLTSPMMRALQDLHVRPLRFYGCDQHTVLSDKPQDEQSFPSGADAFSFVSFGVTDMDEREWHFLLELAPHASWKGCVSELHWAGSPLGYLARSVKNGQDTLRVDLSNCRAIGDAEGHTYRPRASEVDEIEDEIVKQVTALKEKLDAHRKKKALEQAPPGEAAVIAALSTPVGLVLGSMVAAVELESLASGEGQEEEKKGQEPTSSNQDTAASVISASTSADAALSAFSSLSLSSTAAASPSPSPLFPSSSSSSSSSSFDPFAIFTPPAAVAKRTAGPPRGPAAAAAAAAAASASASSSPPPRAQPPILSFGSNQHLESLSALLGGITTASANTQIQTELEGTVARILHLPLFSRYGPTLYTSNHPPAVKRAFTVSLLDEAMTLAPSCGVAAPLPELPIVLLDLIAQYHSFDLPFVEADAAAQLRSAGWLGQPVTRASYPGQSNNPVERLGQLHSEADEILEPVELGAEDDEDGEDQEEEDEEEEDEEDEDEDEEGEDEGDESDDEAMAAALAQSAADAGVFL